MATTPQILVVEDDAAQRALFDRMICLHLPTARVTLAATGADAVAAYQVAGADLLIIDYCLPDMLGTTCMHALRDLGDRRAVLPVILLSGAILPSAVVHVPAAYVLMKPIGMMEFVSTVTQALAAANR